MRLGSVHSVGTAGLMRFDEQYARLVAVTPQGVVVRTCHIGERSRVDR